MTHLAFYDQLSGTQSRKSKVLLPFQRVLRRLLRPMLYRLREILEHLSARQHSQAEELNKANARLATLEQQYQQLSYAHRAFMQDHLAASRRVVMLEDLILQSASNSMRNDSGESDDQTIRSPILYQPHDMRNAS